MPTVRYTTVNGEIIAEKRDGVRRLYAPDPLGSTVAMYDDTQTKTDTFDLWPYGEVRARTGTTPTPFQFGGTTGYYRDTTSRTYVRARAYTPPIGRWLPQDPLPSMRGMSSYEYAFNSPLTWIDPSGLWARWPISPFGLDLELRWGIQSACCAQGVLHVVEMMGLADDWVPGQDKLAHCVASCLIKKVCGHAVAIVAGVLKELKPGQSWWSTEDFCANDRGRWCAERVSLLEQCTGCCYVMYHPKDKWYPIIPWFPPSGTLFPSPDCREWPVYKPPNLPSHSPPFRREPPDTYY